ncbi:hypothetical protein BAOM_3024 [Peribacillus asahii]|uniref:Uncharacterized protein n=2 Tax=Peribacillus asahii TaxID=228899 RepID=A0A3T0KTP2_9BACI|nr:hypothetical protein BAOM_3024 [Peribacillus asahii]
MLFSAALLIVSYLIFVNTSDRKEDLELGDKVTIIMPNGTTIHTYEGYIIKDGDKLIYKGKYDEYNITGGVVEYEE